MLRGSGVGARLIASPPGRRRAGPPRATSHGTELLLLELKLGMMMALLLLVVVCDSGGRVHRGGR